MSRAFLIIADETVRQRAIGLLKISPIGTRVKLQEPKRSLEQNDRLWAMLSDVATQKQHMGVNHSTHIWKCIFMNAMGQETKFLPTLDGTGVFPIGLRSSELSKSEMKELMDFIESWGSQNGVVFNDTYRLKGE